MKHKNLSYQKNITITKFLRDYCLIENENLITMLSALSHKELKAVCRELYKLNLISVPNSTIQQDDINCGDIIVVEDAYHNYAPYKNPSKTNMSEPIKTSYKLEASVTNDLIEDDFTPPEDNPSNNPTNKQYKKKI